MITYGNYLNANFMIQIGGMEIPSYPKLSNDELMKNDSYKILISSFLLGGESKVRIKKIVTFLENNLKDSHNQKE